MEQTTEVKVNSEEIMADIRRKLMEEELGKIPEFESLPLRDGPSTAVMLHPWNYINQHYEVSYSWDMGHGIKAFVKRVIRRVLKCVLIPLITMQNELNANYTRCINELIAITNDLAEQNKRLEQELELLKKENAQQ